ncbi:MAG: preprotein translocase subunit SecA [Candidatus Brocadiae bacterium]|nr:preprotein translocase subunit SecA [Candidatus Brocadiia bacterium]
MNWLSSKIKSHRCSLSRLTKKVAHINELEPWAEKLSLQEIREEFQILRNKIRSGIPLETLIEKAFALVRELSKRTIGKRHYDVQLMSGIGLVLGNVVEMAAGEGKTMVALLPGCMHGLTGKGAHIVTVNRYLAQRDFELMGPVYRELGISVGLVKEDDTPDKKAIAYQSDVTYGVSYAFGFDYLRDQLQLLEHSQNFLGYNLLKILEGKPVTSNVLQRGHAYALVDEVDSILIDEARTPLIISGQSKDSDKLVHNAKMYEEAYRLAEKLQQGEDYFLEDQNKNFQWTQKGQEKVNIHLATLRCDGMKRPWIQYVEQGIRAKLFYRRDKDYLIDSENKIVIVDEFTGRRFADRTWGEGLHQIIQAKEGVAITEEHRSVARITRQRYFKMYEVLSGMTGTASGAEREFSEIYDLPVVHVPLRKPSQRKVFPPRLLVSWEAKWKAIEEEIARIHKTGQPILVGTRTIQQSEECAQRLKNLNLEFQLLNAKQDSEEAQIISQAGEEGKITIATNMAGRGADIHIPPDVLNKGGLHVIAVERHESQRIDNQLIGRCARQGNPGSAQFFTSCEDMLFDLYDPKLGKKLISLSENKNELDPSYYKHFDRLQEKVEKEHLSIRKKMLYYDNWLEKLMESL